jgi:hypothetical protein
MNELEKKLSRRPLKQIPAEWRGEILSAARDAKAAHPESRIPHRSFLSTLNHQLSALLWPHPKAWAGLAAVWIAIIALNLSMRDHSEIVVNKSAPPSPEVVAELKQQKLLFAELIGANDLPIADRQKLFLPRPRSERTEILSG